MSRVSRENKRRERERAAKKWPRSRCSLSAICFSYADEGKTARRCSLCRGMFVTFGHPHYRWTQWKKIEWRVPVNCPYVKRTVARMLEQKMRDCERFGDERREARASFYRNMQCGGCQAREHQRERAKNTPQIDPWRKRKKTFPRRKPK